MFLNNGFLTGLLFEHSTKAADVFSRDGLEDNAVAFLHEVDARAGLDAEQAADA
jgi:hypothetical protein